MTILRLTLPLLALLAAAVPAAADTEFACPATLAVAEQVGTCPSKEELQRTFRFACRRAPDGSFEGPPYCADFGSFTKAKAQAMHAMSIAGEEFMDYLPCTTDAADRAAAKAVSMELYCDRKDRCSLVCEYSNGLEFKMRFGRLCTAEGEKKRGAIVAQCGGDGQGCKATCPDE